MPQQLAVFFPGQGSQALGMLDALAATYPSVRQTFEEASDALGQDLWQLVSSGPEDALNRTENTQPAMLAAGIAVWRVWRQAGGAPATVMAGHSLGEYSALVAAEALGFADGVRLAAERGRLMQAAVPPGEGSMAALLGLDDDTVIALCAEQAGGEVLEAVNFNSPGQVVIAGASAAVARAVEAAKAAGAKRAVQLPVSVPSHCALMRPAAEQLAERLAELDLSLPQVPVLHNVNVAPAADVAELRDLLVQQLYRPVRWVETVRKVAGDGVPAAIESGPGKVLAGLCKRIDRNMTTLPVFDPKTLDAALEATANA
ncbi:MULTISPECIES: ACP S-malonyltransferase [Marichromatium]|uniref:Malonyl CoA-acyl carrier protein transacylase n=1 Tax=Marichromatium gracile TaxID=1048 RepID=A0A4R4AA66_MARGR|nr:MULTISPECIES: ACP S-malonyltransferase [Marichromatium]MBK1708180.1 [acyl-carrier-protein] S-malonyltransferase [Marichromatium gracile]MBO8085970.1 ACP S-malonyltransferase [Marichromatium sp.]RNE89585.1 [acyl-carrier-protein] S-malonyltransferase [Marichromatium sp. AB31]TCW35861.1 [acyl-carrier-protein] S-malonyltransferase [Marichromatium gracile]